MLNRTAHTVYLTKIGSCSFLHILMDTVGNFRWCINSWLYESRYFVWWNISIHV